MSEADAQQQRSRRWAATSMKFKATKTGCYEIYGWDKKCKVETTSTRLTWG